jgi:5-formyltetrahydrofolate cyclo-ligase
MAPTYFRREPGIDAPTAIAAPRFFIPYSPRFPLLPVEDAKTAIRRDALARRSAIPAQVRTNAAQAIAARPLPFDVPAGAQVSGFMPLKHEINPIPLMQTLANAGASLALPVMVARGKPLLMRAFVFGDPLVPGVWGIREPRSEAPEVLPDVMIVPLLAFDRTGHRVGYGAGYFDLTIHALRAQKSLIAVGIAFAAQEIARVPATPRDARLDLVLTERDVIDCRPVKA